MTNHHNNYYYPTLNNNMQNNALAEQFNINHIASAELSVG